MTSALIIGAGLVIVIAVIFAAIANARETGRIQQRQEDEQNALRRQEKMDEVIVEKRSDNTSCNSVTIGGCPSIIKYDREFLTRAAKQFRTLSENSPVRTLITDYGKFRDACRAGGTN